MRRNLRPRVPFRVMTMAAAALLAVVGLAVAPPSASAAPPPMPLVAPPQLPDNARPVCGPVLPGYVHCDAFVRTDSAGSDPTDPQEPAAGEPVPSAYRPADLQDAYGLPSATAGGGQTVAVVDAYDDPKAESDLAVYRAAFGLPPCTTANGCFHKVNQRGETKNYPAPDRHWGMEISLDLDMVSAICPRCHIVLWEADQASQEDLAAAAHLAGCDCTSPAGTNYGARYVSNSYGGPEAGFSASVDDSYRSDKGTVYTVSSGDSGYGVEYPASSKWVTAVGGTSLLPADNARGWDEIAWLYGGSGCSTYVAKPAWQHDGGCSGRSVADVAAVADPTTGVDMYDSYETVDYNGPWLVNGGTSAASPIIAGVYALGAKVLPGTIPSTYPYAKFTQLNDIVGGTNSFENCSPEYLCNAGPGYDGPTGYGTPHGVAAFQE
ncbi:peptidase S8 [Actinocatenispora sera]|uniref:Peptidase S8 n=1 Tax=Actinocatenispora sera TaxID=390989 RepID=A0A810L1K5_9ACTN|nr:peptidase S8 [Actinocatenispora sera]